MDHGRHLSRSIPVPKPLRYIPGSISLALLLPLGLWWMKTRFLDTIPRGVSLTFPTEKGFHSWTNGGREKWIGYAPRLYHCIGSVSEPGMSEEVRAAIHDLVSHKDTLHGMTLSMDRATTYGEVMRVVDHCIHVDTVGFAIWPDGVWIWYNPY